MTGQETLKDEIVALERNYWHQIFVRAEMSKFLWTDDLNLVVLNLLVPGTSNLVDVWKSLRGFWYQL
jgi:hypothetical protein